MPTLTIDHLPIVYRQQDDPSSYRNTLRHWLVFEDGRIFFQDEILDVANGVMTPVDRTAWEQLETPPMTWDCVGIIDHGGLPMALLRNGEAYIWAREEGEAMQRWIRFAEPVPGSHADAGL